MSNQFNHGNQIMPIHQIKYWYRAAWCFEEVEGRDKAIARAQAIKIFGGTLITIIPVESLNHDAIAQ